MGGGAWPFLVGGVKKKHASKFTDILPYKYSNYRANNKLIVYVQNKNKNQSEKIVECIPITYLFANRVRSDF